MKLPIYMDHHATTPLDPEILEAMRPYYLKSLSAVDCEEAIARSREKVAQLIGASPSEIYFTSGATESDNIAIKGVAVGLREKGRHIITSQIEHKAVMDTCAKLERDGFLITYLPVDSAGMISPDDVKKAMRPDTILITLVYGNNEIGTIYPMEAIGGVAREAGVLLHSDAVQAVGKIPVYVDELSVDLLSLSAHKMYGPKGVGALYIRNSVPPIPVESPLGNEQVANVPGIVGLGMACRLRELVLKDEAKRLLALRSRLHERLVRSVEEVYLNGTLENRLPGNLNMSFAHIEGGSLLLSLRDVAVSSGSACTSRTTVDPSYVLMALGRDKDLAQSAIRFGLGKGNTAEEVDYVANAIAVSARKLRSLSARYSSPSPT